MAKYPDYTQTMEWHSDEPVILSWQIKTIAHQWQKFGYFLIIILILGCLGVISGSITYFITDISTALAIAVFSAAFVVMPLVFLFGEVRRKCWMVYRFTDYGAEICYWRAYPKSLFWGIRLLFVGLGIGVLITGIITKMGLLAIAGPVSIALALGSFAITKNYEKDMINFTWTGFGWENIIAAQYDIKCNVICLCSKIPLTPENRAFLIAEGCNPDQVILESNFYLFPTPELTSQVIQLVESSLQKDVKLEYKKIILPEVV